MKWLAWSNPMATKNRAKELSPYQKFLADKAQLTGEFGFKPIWIPDCVFDFQRLLITWSLRKGRGGLFEDCGLGKTLQELVVAFPNSDAAAAAKERLAKLK